MALLHIPLAQIDEARLQALIAAGAAESRTIDYKRTIYGNAHADHSEFLADTSSFANTSGGDLVLGMAATNGIPTAITPLSMPMDPEILRLEQIARGGLQPRIADIAFHAVPIQAGGSVLVIRVARSYNASRLMRCLSVSSASLARGLSSRVLSGTTNSVTLLIGTNIISMK
jgi:hypothetical protein